MLAAYKAEGTGAVTVKTLDLKSYSAIVPGKLSLDVWDMRGEEVRGVIRIFATVKVPDKAESVNQVWQVGPSVTAGRIDRHDFAPPNINAKGVLSFNGSQSGGGGGGAVDPVTMKKNVSFFFLIGWGVQVKF